MPIDLITGDPKIREQIEAGEDITAISSQWKEAEDRFVKRVRPFYLYGE